MRERPILFSGEMVRAILEGRKTQTRRVIKPQFGTTWGQGVRNQDPDCFSVHVDIREPNGEWRWLRCPYGKKGDLLLVRETWRPAASIDSPYFFVPRSASRIALEVIRIKAERVQGISREDILAEGIGVHKFARGVLCDDWHPQKPFHDLWDSINAKRGYSWESNPWVWAIEFKQVSV